MGTQQVLNGGGGRHQGIGFTYFVTYAMCVMTDPGCMANEWVKGHEMGHCLLPLQFFLYSFHTVVYTQAMGKVIELVSLKSYRISNLIAKYEAVKLASSHDRCWHVIFSKYMLSAY